jgi:hypothetical protein
MKRTFSLIVAGIAAVALFAGLVHVVLVAAHVSAPAATTVQGLTSRRLWATTVVGLGLASVVIAGLALATRFGASSRRLAGIVALVAAVIAAVNGAFVVAMANGGPGSGNGVVGGAAALVLGLIGMSLSALALSRTHRSLSAD